MNSSHYQLKKHTLVENSLKKSVNESSKSFADMRIKMGDKRNNQTLDVDERDSALSDLEGEEWNEIVKFQKEKFEEEKQRKLEEFQ